MSNHFSETQSNEKQLLGSAAASDSATARCFLCDAMLGTLCRWLRFLGFDSEFAGVSDADEVIAERAASEGRWLLTRDRLLAAAGPPRTVLIRSVDLDDQLVEVCRRFGLRPEPNLEASRCGECNGALIDVEAARVADIVPPYVLQTAERFRQCSTCHRVYWPGTHTERITARLQGIVADLYHHRDD